ncbi:helix-turn-helix transcriptional regulator [Marivivens donghaensis]|uniref:Helix-turn-helix transcriptional regulator n=1 Tax=Marivivens donghaensis TaxID=1699413 RepID=A0ABX0VYH7_9RHOB|nr:MULTISPECIES: helix-turn-helix domain-containing protein [Marivivens]NIY71964.1 helix-turn-helix transcriptional regulator [Marivivens donghaensis]
MAQYTFRTRSSDCPYELAIGLVSGRWKPRLLEVLKDETLRYGDLKERLKPVSDKVLSAALDDMTRNGLISRTAFAEIPPRVEYALTPQGESLLEALGPLRDWARTENGR